ARPRVRERRWYAGGLEPISIVTPSGSGDRAAGAIGVPRSVPLVSCGQKELRRDDGVVPTADAIVLCGVPRIYDPSPYNPAMKILAAVLLFTGAGGTWLAAAEPVVLVRCGRVIDGRGDQATGPAVVQISGDRITAIGKDLPAAGAQTIDLADATCLPGLIDLHAHILIN